MDPTKPPAVPGAASLPGGSLPEIFGHGGLEGVLNSLRSAGYGPQVDSWLSSGANHPISAEALHAALGPETVQRIAASTGMAPAAVGQMLANVMPMVVSHLSSTGQFSPLGSGARTAGLAELSALLGGMFGGGGAGSMGGLGGILSGMGGIPGMGGSSGIPGMGGIPGMPNIPGMNGIPGMGGLMGAGGGAADADTSTPPAASPGAELSSDLGTINVPPANPAVGPDGRPKQP